MVITNPIAKRKINVKEEVKVPSETKKYAQPKKGNPKKKRKIIPKESVATTGKAGVAAEGTKKTTD